MSEQTSLDIGAVEFGAPPASVKLTLKEMETIAQRRAANERLAAERDTER